MPGSAQCPESVALLRQVNRKSHRPAKSLGSTGSMQAAGSDTNLWQRSPGCVRDKLLAGDTGREKRYRESKEGCSCLGLAQAKEGDEDCPWPSCGQEKPSDGHIPSRREVVTVCEQQDLQLTGQALNPSLLCVPGMWLCRAAPGELICLRAPSPPAGCYCHPQQHSLSKRSPTSHG